jgi:S1-C subfamily serine protease/thioredoxin-related protein
MHLRVADVSTVVCPNCGVRLQVSGESTESKKIRCPKCQARFETLPSVEPVSKSKPTAPPRRSTPRDDEVDDRARPRAKRSVYEDEDESDQDDDPRPRKKKKGRKSQKSGNLILFVSIGSVVLVAGIGLASYLLYAIYAGFQPNKGQDIAAYNANIKPVVNQAPGVNITASGVIKPTEAWTQDLAKAKKDAAEKKLNILILFDGSDWSLPCRAMQQEVLKDQHFWDFIDDKFIPVFIDFPHNEAAKKKVKNAEENERLKKEFDISSFPTLLMMDAEGLPFGVLQSYTEGTGAAGANLSINHCLAQKNTRDRQLESIAKATGAEKLTHARALFEMLELNQLVPYYSPQLKEWAGLARKYDKGNDEGHLEFFLAKEWLVRPQIEDNKEIAKRLKDLQQWEKSVTFKDQNLGAEVYSYAAIYHLRCAHIGAARDMLRKAKSFKPTDPQLLAHLHPMQQYLTEHLEGPSSGTGFLVGEGGLIMTNRHVVDGSSKLTVRFPHAEKPVPAEIVSFDADADMALIRCVPPPGAKVTPLALAGEKPVRRGEEVGIFGYPLGASKGESVKFAVGHVMALPEKVNEDMLMLDGRVNPGNSGGPLCDSTGRVIGMVTAKTMMSQKLRVESYGLALPANTLRDFLKKNNSGYKDAAATEKGKPWVEVDPIVSPAVVLISNDG